MIKESIKRKCIITTIALLIFLITISFPSSPIETENMTLTYDTNHTSPVYLLDSSSYVSRADLYVKDDDETIETAKNILTLLTIQEKYSSYIPSFFNAVIPKGTKILAIDLQDKTLKINLSKEFLSIPKGYEEKLIECIVYSLTELEGIDGIILFVEGELLTTIPNTNIKIPPLLTREIGINKIYRMDSLKDVTKTTIYYIAKEQDFTYYVPVTLLENTDKNKIEVIIEHLKSLPYERTNLMSYLNASTELTNYEILESQVLLSFSPILYEGLASEEMLEEVKYSISLSIEDTLNVKEVIFMN